MNREVPLVSVIVPVCNGKYIGEALQSIQNQDYSPIEIIVVNDGSTDDTANIVSRFKGIRLISTENRGVAAARNTGLAMATGEWITFLDSDDLWVPGKTRIQVGFLLDHGDVDGVYGRFENFIEEGAAIPGFIDRKAFLNPEKGRMITLGALMVKTEAAREIGDFAPGLRTGEDLDWFIRWKEGGRTVSFDDRVVLKRRLHGSNLSYESVRNKGNLLKMIKSSLDRKRGR